MTPRRSFEPVDPEAFHAMVAASADGLLIIDGEGVVRFANPAACSLFRGRTSELVGYHLGVPAIREPVTMLLFVDGQAAHVELRASEIMWEGREAMIASLSDVTVRERAEHALRESVLERDRLLALAERTRLAQLSMLEDQLEDTKRLAHRNRVLGAIGAVNRLAESGLDSEQLVKEACDLLVEQGSYDSALLVLTDDDGRPTVWSDGRFPGTACRPGDVLGGGGLPPCCARALEVEGPLLVRDTDGLCETCTLAHHTGDEAVLVTRVAHAGRLYGALLVGLASNRGRDNEERKLFAKLADDLGVSLDSSVHRAALARSEQDREAAQQQLLQSQKMEAVGRLAGGVAHDYNNMLSVILGYASMALERLDPGDPLHADLDQIRQAANRSARITRQLLGFARQQAVEPVVLDLHQAVGQTLSMIRRLIGEDVDLAWHRSERVPLVKIDPVQLDQVLANLCVNARDALPGGGHIDIATDVVELDSQAASRRPGTAPGTFASLTIRDDGEGMDEATLENVFEPFFTTKERGQGTGLGMSTVYGIVKQNQGYIEVESHPGQGTEITILLPISEEPVHTATKSHDGTLVRGSGETILMVEDEHAILAMTQKVLNRVGYRVLVAGTPEEALALTRDHSEEIDLVITDVLMPGMNGRDLAERLRLLRPHVPVLFMSGHTADIIADQGVIGEGMNFIQKPFEIQAFCAKVRALLDTAEEIVA